MPAQSVEFHISGEEIRAAVHYPDLIKAFEVMHREDPAVLEDSLLTEPGTGEHPDRFIVRTAWQRAAWHSAQKWVPFFQATEIPTCRWSRAVTFCSMETMACLWPRSMEQN